MKKNKLYIILPILIFTIFLVFSGVCFESSADKAKEAAEEVGKSVQKATEEIEEAVTGKNTDDIETKQTTEEEKAVEVTGSEQSENVDNLQDNQQSNIVTLKGYVSCETLSETKQVPLSITINNSKKTIEGDVTLYWEEKIETSAEGEESHHSHNYICRIELKGKIFGKITDIKNDYNIDAKLSGFTSCSYGYDPNSTEQSLQATDFCEKEFNGLQKNFTFEGIYVEGLNKAEGRLKPQGWYWYASKN